MYMYVLMYVSYTSTVAVSLTGPTRRYGSHMVDRVGAGALLASLMLGHLGTFHLLGYAVGPS